MSTSTIVLSATRSLIREFARNAGDQTYYSTRMIDFAFRRAANYLIREAMLCLRTDTIPTVAGTDAYNTPTGFRADRFDAAWLTGANVALQGSPRIDSIPYGVYTRGGPVPTDYGQATPSSARLTSCQATLINDLAIANADSGQPQILAFKDDGTLRVYPNPDQVYTLNLRWFEYFTDWHLGIPTATFTNTAGVLSAVVVTDGSDNQGAALTASFTDTGSGSGATATATLANGVLSSVAVGAGGTNYSSGTKLLLGGFDSTDTTFNLPDDYLAEIISLGAPAFLQFNDPEKLYATEKGKEFLAFVDRVKGRIGGLGAQRIISRRR